MSGGVGTLDTTCSLADIRELRSNGEMSGAAGISCWYWVALADGVEMADWPPDDVDDSGEKTSS